MTPTPATDARAAERSPMAHRAHRPAPRAAAAVPDDARRAVSSPVVAAHGSRPRPAASPTARAARTARRPASPVVAALAAEAADVVAIARRVVPNRRAAVLVGLALLAVLALGGMAGAAEPKPANRSALDAFAGSAVPAATAAAPASVAAAITPASAPSAGPAVVAPSGFPAANGASGASATALADDPAFQGPNLFDLVTKTALVVALLFVTLRVLRRVQGAGPTRGSGLLAVLESRSLGPKTQLHLVAVGDRRLVIGQSPAGLVALGELDAAELPVAEAVSEPWDRRDRLDANPELEAQAAHELASGRRSRLGVSA